MTNEDREVWREAYDLYDWNHAMPNTEGNWLGFFTALSAFAERHGWRSNCLARALALALIDAVEGEVKQRMEEERRRPVQLSLFPAESSSGE